MKQIKTTQQYPDSVRGVPEDQKKGKIISGKIAMEHIIKIFKKQIKG